MSKIDERVVSMKFNSDQFARGVADTSSALDRLKSALKMDGAGKDLGNLSLGGLANSVSDVSTRFTGLQAVALGALATIGAKAVDTAMQIGQSFVSNLTSSARQGFAEYETQMGAIQTIMANTSSKGTTMGQVNEALAELNTYADKTIYNFSEMTRNIGTFTAAGVDLGTATNAIKGIANLAAVSGSNAQQASTAMYQLSQAMASGTVKLMDWNSVVNAGMGGQVFQDALKETARNSGVAIDEIIAKHGSFRESLTEGWLTTAVLTDTLAKFTGDLSKEQLLSQGYTEAQAEEIMKLGVMANDAATKVKTFSQLMETLAEAQGSGWAQSFQIILGDFEEAKALFTEISDRVGAVIGESAAARNAQLQIWKDMGGRTAIIDALRNAFDAVMKVVTPIKEAFADVFPPSMGKNLAAISFALRDFTAGLIISDEAAANIKMVATGLFTVLKFGVDIVMGLAKAIGFLIGFAFRLAGAIFGLISPIFTFVRSLLPVQEGAKDATSSVEGFFDMLVTTGQFLTGWIIDGLKSLGDLFNNFLNGSSAQGRIESFKSTLEGLGEAIASMWNLLTKGDFTDNPFFGENSGIAQTLLNIRNAVEVVTEAFGKFKDGVSDAAGNASSFWMTVWGAVKKVWEFIKPVVDGIGKLFSDIISGLDLETILAGINAGVLIGLAVGIGKVIKSITGAFGGVGDIMGGLGDSLNGLVGVLEGYQKRLKAEALMKVAIGIGVLAGALWVLSTIDPGRLVSSVTAMATSFGLLLAGLAILDKIDAEPSLKASVAISLIAVAVNILATAVSKMGALNPDQLSNGLVGIALAMGLLVAAAMALDTVGDGILKSAAALVVMAVALNMLVIPITALGFLPLPVLIQGMAALAIMLTGLVIATKALAGLGPQLAVVALGMMAMAVAINMLVIPLTTLGLLPFPVLLQGMLALGILLVGMVLLAQQLATVAPQMALAAVGMMAMAAAINMMVIPITILGALPLPNLIIGLAAMAVVLAALVIATNAMTTAMPGAVAMLAVAGALMILSLALAVMAGIGIEGIIIAILGLVGAVLAMAIISAILAPISPAMYAVAGAMALFAVGALALAAAMVIMAFGLMLIGPAIMMAVGGLLVFAAVAPQLAASVPPMLALGAGLLVFGAGALIAGLGALVLGAGLLVMGAGLAIVAAVGILGAMAMTMVVEAMMGMLGHIPGMLALGGAFVVLGGGTVILGAGLLLLAAGALLTAIALMMIVPLGGKVKSSIEKVIKSIEKLAPMSGQISSISSSLNKLGSAVAKVADNGKAAASGLQAISMQFNLLSVGAMMAATSIRTMAASVPPSIAMMLVALQRGPVAFQSFALAASLSMTTLNNGLRAGSARATATMTTLGRAVGSTLVRSISSSYGGVFSASVVLGLQMTQGMNRGLQNGSWAVSSMAAQVARQALNSAKRELGVASPSKEFTKVGEESDNGLVNGLYNHMGAVSDAGADVGKAALVAVRNSLSKLKSSVATDMDFDPTIRPVLDLSGIKNGVGALDSMLTPRTLQVSDSYAMASSLAVQQRAADNDPDDFDGPNDPRGGGNTFIQNNYSPKALSRAEIYRESKNLFAMTKGGTST